jgi:hypothetical protein
MVVKGYKVFNSDWTCRDKRYTCPGEFEEDVELDVCHCGLHFCKKAADCFNYYSFDSSNRVAEVIAYGEVKEKGNKCCTNKLKIVRELSWYEVLDVVNTGENCTGKGNSGNWNTGDYNDGYRNSGDKNGGDWNSGSCNSGHCNSGNHNSGGWNSGSYNSGNSNVGSYNSGNWNSGSRNSGSCNSGHCNSGNHNSGDYNIGNWNSGDWNKINYSNGCFNTIEPKIKFFNKESNLTYRDWLLSDAKKILKKIPTEDVKYTQVWWNRLEDTDKQIILNIPNFDREIFKEITGIDVNKA